MKRAAAGSRTSTSCSNWPTHGIIPGTTICGLADGAAWPVKNAITKFRGEFEAYIRSHRGAPEEVTRLQEAIAHGVPADPTEPAADRAEPQRRRRPAVAAKG